MLNKFLLLKSLINNQNNTNINITKSINKRISKVKDLVNSGIAANLKINAAIVIIQLVMTNSLINKQRINLKLINNKTIKKIISIINNNNNNNNIKINNFINNKH